MADFQVEGVRIRVNIVPDPGHPKRRVQVLRLYLAEIDRQCRFAKRSFEQLQVGLRKSKANNDQTWHAVQSFLTAAAVISRILDASHVTDKSLKELSKDRARELQELLGLSTPTLADRNIRNSLEHIDERLDELEREGLHLIVDGNVLSGKIRLLPLDESREFFYWPLRELDIDRMRVRFGHDQIDLLKLREEIIALHSKTSKILSVPVPVDPDDPRIPVRLKVVELHDD